MSKLFACPCGRRWVVYIGKADTSTCCGLPLSPVDDAKMLPERLSPEDALERSTDRGELEAMLEKVLRTAA